MGISGRADERQRTAHELSGWADENQPADRWRVDVTAGMLAGGQISISRRADGGWMLAKECRWVDEHDGSCGQIHFEQIEQQADTRAWAVCHVWLVGARGGGVGG